PRIVSRHRGLVNGFNQLGEEMTDNQPTFTTTDAGIPVSSDEHSLTVGADGPILLQDHYLIEQMANFNRERVPERQPHAKGSGAFGYFEDITPRSSRPHSPRAIRCPAPVSARTKCCWPARSPTPTPTAPGSGSITSRFRSTRPRPRCTPTPRTVRCA